jgi:hypothetical protein
MMQTTGVHLLGHREGREADYASEVPQDVKLSVMQAGGADSVHMHTSWKLAPAGHPPSRGHIHFVTCYSFNLPDISA